MNISDEEVYKPEAGFEEDTREPLVDISFTDSTELWLIKWPPNQLPDFQGKELALNLQNDGCLCSFEGSSGKVYDVASISNEGPDTMVFLSTASETKYVGNITRHVSLVHAPDAKELKREEAEKKSKKLSQMSAGSSFMNSFSTPTQSTKLRSSISSRGNAASTHSSRHKSSISEVGEQSSMKKRRKHQHTASTDRSTLDSGRGHSNHTVSRS